MTESWFTSTLHHTFSILRDILFPLTCLGCDREKTLACPECLGKLPEKTFQECPVCRKPYQKNGAVCRQCRSQTTLDGLFIARPYQHHLIQKLVFALKYRFLEIAASPLASLLTEALNRHPIPLPDLVIPVPLHSRRLRYRGFNQSELIARKTLEQLLPKNSLSSILRTDLLERVRFTKPQMKTESKTERIANLNHAFVVPTIVAGPLVGASIWLIDDVATTGSTLDECARVLKAAGAKSVWGVVVAR